MVGRHLGEHPDVDVLTFTGSTEVGRHFMRYSADSNLKRVYLELGGKSPNIIFPDAPDLDAAADAAAWAIYFNSGEMCTAGSRLVVHADVAEQVLERIVDTAAQWFPADPLLPDTKMGPLVDERSLQRVLGHLDRGLAEGAALRVGGQRVLSETGGAYLEPTVVTGAAPDNPIIRDEIFGPVLAVQVVSDEAEAVRIAGDTPVRPGGGPVDFRFGNCASGITRFEGGDCLGQLLRGGGHGRTVRRRQAVRLRPGQVSACPGGIHLSEDDLDPICMKKLLAPGAR